MVLLLREPEAVKTFAPAVIPALRLRHHAAQERRRVINAAHARRFIHPVVQRRRRLQERHIIWFHDDDARDLRGYYQKMS